MKLVSVIENNKKIKVSSEVKSLLFLAFGLFSRTTASAAHDYAPPADDMA